MFVMSNDGTLTENVVIKVTSLQVKHGFFFPVSPGVFSEVIDNYRLT